MADAKRDNNRVATLLVVSNADNTTPLPVKGDAATGAILTSGSNATLTLNRQTALSNTAVAIKASAGVVWKVAFFNGGAADAYVQFYDVAQGSVNVGTTTPSWTWWVPAGGWNEEDLQVPFTAATAITIAATTTVTGGTAPGTALLAQVAYV